MNTRNRKSRLLWVLISVLPAIAALTALILYLEFAPFAVSARGADGFGPACGSAVVDGVINPQEWIGASTQALQMVRNDGNDLLAATLYVMNDGADLYLGVTVNDNEFTTSGKWLPGGDSSHFNFDNDRSGSIFELWNDVLDAFAGPPQFGDGYIYNTDNGSSQSDDKVGGTVDGAGAASRVGDLNHFELKHPLCSGDALDFCLHPGDSVGFRLEYLDAVSIDIFGGSQWFPGFGNSQAVIAIGQCAIPVSTIHLPLITK